MHPVLGSVREEIETKVVGIAAPAAHGIHEPLALHSLEVSLASFRLDPKLRFATLYVRARGAAHLRVERPDAHLGRRSAGVRGRVGGSLGFVERRHTGLPLLAPTGSPADLERVESLGQRVVSRGFLPSGGSALLSLRVVALRRRVASVFFPSPLAIVGYVAIAVRGLPKLGRESSDVPARRLIANRVQGFDLLGSRTSACGPDPRVRSGRCGHARCPYRAAHQWPIRVSNLGVPLVCQPANRSNRTKSATLCFLLGWTAGEILLSRCASTYRRATGSRGRVRSPKAARSHLHDDRVSPRRALFRPCGT